MHDAFVSPRPGHGQDSQESAPPVSSAPVHADEPYVVVARRYRPQSFAQLVGQEHVRAALTTAIASGQIGHAYLFSGPRGTGKTSTARILAKSLNCQKGGPRPDPCGQCASCRGIEAGNSLDVIEIDAASNTGVDNIRDLRSGVVLAPFSRYKVYIIDEVHMLSTQAFNALLKTLEEPPPQVVFVLATTEMQKVPETIISRCQTFAFRRFTVAEIVGQLDAILDAECQRRKVTVPSADRRRILELIARNAEGGMRDAQVALDQVLVLCEDKLDFDSVARFLGAVETDVLDAFTRALAARRAEELLLTIDDLVARGHDLERFVKTFVAHLRDVLIVRSAPHKPELLNVSPDRLAMLRALAADMPLSFLINSSETLLRLLEDLKTASQSRFLLELAIIRLCTVDAVDDIASILSRLQELEKALASGEGGGPRQSLSAGAWSSPPAAGSARPETPAADRVEEAPVQTSASKTSESGMVPAGTPAAAAPPAESATMQIAPERFLAELRERCVAHNHYLHVSLLETTILSFNGRVAVLGVKATDRFTHDHLERPRNQEILRKVAREITGQDIVFRVQFTDEPAVPAPSPSKSDQKAPVAVSVPVSQAPAAAEAEDQMTEGELNEELIARHEADMIAINRLMGPREFKGLALKQYASKHTDLARLIDRLKTALQLDDSCFTFRLYS
jgi:DNA polymerase-3 subunit gamma/tau